MGPNDLTHKNHLARAYGLDSQAKTDAFYSDWAETYDAELVASGYATPGRCAAALKAHAPDLDIKVLDIGCGTGLSGSALHEAGFTNLSGSDVNPDMLARAERRGVYRTVWQADPEAPFPFDTGTYDAITAIGVIGRGAAPISVLEGALSKLAPGGLCVFSFNDHTLEDPSFEAAVTAESDAGRFAIGFKEHGPHIPAKGLEATVYVLKRL
ncbi:MAG: methyltransferase domain-containing protein [Pseudomonadota bacterium]